MLKPGTAVRVTPGWARNGLEFEGIVMSFDPKGPLGDLYPYVVHITKQILRNPSGHGKKYLGTRQVFREEEIHPLLQTVEQIENYLADS